MFTSLTLFWGSIYGSKKSCREGVLSKNFFLLLDTMQVCAILKISPYTFIKKSKVLLKFVPNTYVKSKDSDFLLFMRLYIL